MRTLGIDRGASFVDVVIFDGQKIFFKKTITRKEYSPDWLKTLPNYDKIVTAQEKNEFDCLAKGGLFLSGLETAVVVSCGTGTAAVLAQKDKPSQHLGGTAVGGGTLTGLGKLILNTDSAEMIFELAKKGSRTLVDLTVGDVLGQGIGLLPKEATASNFGKLKSRKKEDLAQSLVGMVAETIGLISCLTAKSVAQKNVVYVGRLATSQIIKAYLTQIAALFNLTPVFPQSAEYCVALGAAL